MKSKTLFASIALASGMLFSPLASAVFVSSTSAAAGNIVTDYSGVDVAAINLDIAVALPPTTVNFQIERGDGASLAFNAVIANLFGQGIGRFLLTLENATFVTIGSVGTSFGSVPTTSGAGAIAGIEFLPAENLGFTLGNPYGLSATDWTIDISNLTAGDSFALRLAVPEPGSMPLVLAALALCATSMCRRTRQD